MNRDFESDYRKIGDVSFRFFYEQLEDVGSPLLPWAYWLWMTLRRFTALGEAQMWRECQFETDRDLLHWTDFNPFNMKEWPEDPRTWQEIGVVGTKPTGVGGPDYLCFAGPIDAATEYLRRIANDPDYKAGVYRKLAPPTLKNFINNAYVKLDEKHPTTGTDNRSYYGDMQRILGRYLREDTYPFEDTPAMSYLTNWPGIPGGPLETSFPINLKFIPAANTWQRPGLLLRGSFDTAQHMTANWNTLAPGEAGYFRGGAEGRQASVHACIDDVVCEGLLPGNEVGWHASDGAGPGNYGTFALELVQLRAMVNNPTRWRRARRNAAELMGKVSARKKGKRKGKFHHDYAPNKKWCPEVLLNNPTWVAEYHADYAYFYDAELKAMAGGGTTDPITIINIGDTIKTLVNVNLRQRGTTVAPVIALLPQGTEAVVNGRFEAADGYGWLPVTTELGNGFVAMGDTTAPYIEKVASAPTPITFAPRSPIPALLLTDLQYYNTAKGIRTDDTGNEFIFVADVIEFTKETVAGEFATDNPRPVKAPYQAKDRAIAAWLVKGTDEAKSWHYLLAGGDDEWVRVRYDHTDRVSDAPLLPESAAVA